MKSLNSNVQASVTFINRANCTVIIFWLDYGGSLRQYKTLNDGTQYTQGTFITNPWCFRDALTGRVLVTSCGEPVYYPNGTVGGETVVIVG